MRTLLVTVVCMLVLRGTSEACKLAEHPSRFELFDRASEVVIAKVIKAPKADREGKVVLELVTTLKGKPASKIELAQGGSTCDAHFPGGAKLLVFISDGKSIGHYDGPIDAKQQPWAAFMKRWSAATDDAARAGIAADAIARGKQLANAGIRVFLNQPDVVEAVVDTHVATIKKAWNRLDTGQQNLLKQALGKRLP